MQETLELNRDIATLETRHKRTLDATTYQELTAKRNQLTAHLNRAIQRSYQHYRHMIHEHGDKCGRLLGNLLKQRKTQLYIPKIKDTQQRLKHLPDQIATEFRTYYQGLYHLRQDEPGESQSSKLADVRRYIGSAHMPEISETDREALEAPITPEELAYAIKKAKTGKAPGPDGLPLQYYKVFTQE
ncbi:metabotropic glutamate receptor 2-like, partial [Pelobates cultripes]